MENTKKINAPADFWGDAMLLSATLRAIAGTAEAYPEGCIGNQLSMLKKCAELAVRIEGRIEISVLSKESA